MICETILQIQKQKIINIRINLIDGKKSAVSINRTKKQVDHNRAKLLLAEYIGHSPSKTNISGFLRQKMHSGYTPWAKIHGVIKIQQGKINQSINFNAKEIKRMQH